MFDQSWEPLFNAAKAVRLNAHAPYSKFLVGAAVETQDGLIFSGCNVENASFGGTICAERNAVFQMIATCGRVRIARVCVVLLGADKPGGSPCGFCRQVIWEFCDGNGDVPVLMANPEGSHRITTMGSLLPDAFTLVSD